MYCGFIMIIVSVVLVSCQKDGAGSAPLGSIKIVNTITGGETARFGSLTTTVSSNNHVNYSLSLGNPAIYVWPASDSLKPYYNSGKGVTVAAGDYYSLFLSGTPSQNEGILVRESYQNYTDSVAGIRFINLSPNSSPVNVTLSTSTSVNQFSNVGYKEYTSFKSFAAASINTNYTFQVRSASNPTLVLASVTMSGTSVNAYVPRFKNVTLVFKGLIGGTGINAPSIVRVNYY